MGPGSEQCAMGRQEDDGWEREGVSFDGDSFYRMGACGREQETWGVVRCEDEGDGLQMSRVLVGLANGGQGLGELWATKRGRCGQRKQVARSQG